MLLAQYPKVRLGVYLTSLALTIVGIVVVVINQAVGAALLTAAGTLSIAANATAANNVALPPAAAGRPRPPDAASR